jgi:hypothetical protein
LLSINMHACNACYLGCTCGFPALPLVLLQSLPVLAYQPSSARITEVISGPQGDPSSFFRELAGGQSAAAVEEVEAQKDGGMGKDHMCTNKSTHVVGHAKGACFPLMSPVCAGMTAPLITLLDSPQHQPLCAHLLSFVLWSNKQPPQVWQMACLSRAFVA